MFKKFYLSGSVLLLCFGFFFIGNTAFSQELPKFNVDSKSKNTGDKSVKSSDPDINAFIPVEKEPTLTSKAKPGYPELARSARIEGCVWVKVLVEKDGKVKKAVVIKSDAEVFNEDAMAAAKKCSFEPAQMNGSNVACWATVSYNFKLKS
jgi:TonB family protein